MAERYELLNPKPEQVWHNVNLSEARDDYHFVLVGSSSHDPAKAWTTFQQDLVDPVLKTLPDVSSTVPEIFAAYASQAPDEAWNLILNNHIIHPAL